MNKDTSAAKEPRGDAFLPPQGERRVCRGGHAAWGTPGPWICNHCGKDVRTNRYPDGRRRL